MSAYGVIKNYCKLFKLKRKWRDANCHNTTQAVNYFDPGFVHVGNCTYGKLNVLTYNKENHLYIGNYCSIGPNVKFILSADHKLEYISTFPFKVKVMNYEYEGVSKGDIVIDDDVWIGYGSTILSGVHIGQGAVVAAGAVVVSDIEPYTIVGGVPSRLIRKRFNDDLIEYLVSLDYSQLSNDIVKLHIEELYSPLERLTVEEIAKLFNWFPKKYVKV